MPARARNCPGVVTSEEERCPLRSGSQEGGQGQAGLQGCIRTADPVGAKGRNVPHQGPRSCVMTPPGLPGTAHMGWGCPQPQPQSWPGSFCLLLPPQDHPSCCPFPFLLSPEVLMASGPTSSPAAGILSRFHQEPSTGPTPPGEQTLGPRDQPASHSCSHSLTGEKLPFSSPC